MSNFIDIFLAPPPPEESQTCLLLRNNVWLHSICLLCRDVMLKKEILVAPWWTSRNAERSDRSWRDCFDDCCGFGKYFHGNSKLHQSETSLLHRRIVRSVVLLFSYLEKTCFYLKRLWYHTELWLLYRSIERFCRVFNISAGNHSFVWSALKLFTELEILPAKSNPIFMVCIFFWRSM